MNAEQSDWDADYRAGRLRFLDRGDEQLRHAVVAGMIALKARGEVIDLGCGRGHLLAWLAPEAVSRYVGVDVAAAAVGALPASAIPASGVVSAIETFVPEPRATGAVVCSEALYFVADAVAALTRIVGSLPAVRRVIVSLVGPNARRPNWQRDSDRIWRAFEATGWPLDDKVRLSSLTSDKAWDIAAYDPRRPGGS